MQGGEEDSFPITENYVNYVKFNENKLYLDLFCVIIIKLRSFKLIQRNR